MKNRYNVLMLGASYGSLLATKLLMAGHDVTLVCLPEEADLINADGIRLRMPLRDREGLVEVHSKTLPGSVNACGAGDPNPNDYDLVGLAMQEPQYRVDGVRELLKAVGKAGVPCMSIMNMPPLPYLARIPVLDAADFNDCYTDASVWADVDPACLTLCSPDPQAFRPPDEPANVLQVSLPTNFKAARFHSDRHTNILRHLEHDIAAARHVVDGESLELPVKLKVHESVFVPLAKWSMLLAGNYRCVQESSPRSIAEAVHSDIEASRAVYEWVSELCRSLGASEADQVPFEKYANAAKGLAKPSSAARALFSGAPFIERVDRLVQRVASEMDESSELIDGLVALIDARLAANRAGLNAA